MGSDEYLREIAALTPAPVLRKDFIIDGYQIYEAKILGASAVLLIAALLSQKELADFTALSRSLGLDALVETHSAEEVERAAGAGARIIGVNNRDLRTFTVDLATTARLRPLIPAGTLAVSESGVSTPEDAAFLSRLEIDALLVGESMMRAPDKREYLRALGRAANPGPAAPGEKP
jgi:indole-3-glycerol phosphate synthase